MQIDRHNTKAADKAPTMIFDKKCEVKFDHDREAREIVAQA